MQLNENKVKLIRYRGERFSHPNPKLISSSCTSKPKPSNYPYYLNLFKYSQVNDQPPDAQQSQYSYSAWHQKVEFVISGHTFHTIYELLRNEYEYIIQMYHQVLYSKAPLYIDVGLFIAVISNRLIYSNYALQNILAFAESALCLRCGHFIDYDQIYVPSYLCNATPPDQCCHLRME